MGYRQEGRKPGSALFVALLAACSALLAPPVNACSTTTPCAVDEGAYFIAMPEDVPGPVPAVMFIHGYGGSGEGVFRNTGMVDQFLARGYAVVAPSGTEMEGRGGRTWSFHPDRPQRRDEIAFLKSVRDAVIAEHDIDPDAILLAGFSIGGSMASYLACAEPEAFTAYAPVGGSFWRPHPDGCAGPVRLLHTHGWTDGTVPLEGRVLRGDSADAPGSVAQGDVFHAMELWRQVNDCAGLRADSFVTEGPFWRRKWERCMPGTALELALFPGGHVIPRDWPGMAIDWFEGLPAGSF